MGSNKQNDDMTWNTNIHVSAEETVTLMSSHYVMIILSGIPLNFEIRLLKVIAKVPFIEVYGVKGF